MIRKEKDFCTYKTTLSFNKNIYELEWKTISIAGCVLLLKSRLQAVHRTAGAFIYLSLKESSLDTKVKENTWIELSITTLLVLFKSIWISSLLPLSLGWFLGQLRLFGELGVFFVRKVGMGAHPLPKISMHSTDESGSRRTVYNNKHVETRWVELAQPHVIPVMVRTASCATCRPKSHVIVIRRAITCRIDERKHRRVNENIDICK